MNAYQIVERNRENIITLPGTELSSFAQLTIPLNLYDVIFRITLGIYLGEIHELVQLVFCL